MVLILLLGLLQAPDDVADFVASLEKEAAAGATPQDLLKKLGEWSKGKPEDVQARLAWNRGLLEATIKVDELFAEGLRQRVGKHVALGRAAGVVQEVKNDRVTLAAAGETTEVEFSTIPLDVRLEDVKRQKLLPSKSREEAVFRFAGGRSVAALAAAMALPEEEKEAALTAIAGFVMQETDRILAPGATLKAVESFASTWGKQPDLMRANWGALRKYVDRTVVTKLLDQADAVPAKDKKEARKLLDLAASLCRSDEAVAKVTARRWGALEKKEWMGFPLQTLTPSGGTPDGTKIVCEDTTEGPEASTVQLNSLPVPWGEISGIRSRIQPGTAAAVSMRIRIDKLHHCINFEAKEPSVLHASYEDRQDQAKNSPGKRITLRKDYEFRAERTGSRWKFFIDTTELSAEDGNDPSLLQWVIGDGKAEILSLEVRKK